MSFQFSRLRAAPVAGLVAALVVTAAAAAAPATVDLVFYAPHFAKVADGSTITYHFVRKAEDPSLAPSFEDDVKLLVGPAANKNSVQIDVFTGSRAFSLPNMSKTGNPVIVALLEQDVKEMNKTLGGSPFYFRNRLRQAIADQKPAEPTKIEYDGKTIDGWKITLKPFAKDAQNRSRLGDYADRTYELTFADDVPGGLYALKAVTPKADGSGATLVEELTVKGEAASAEAKPAEGAK